MARAIWKGSIAFGLVSIPIELHTAIREHRPHFRLLHAKDKSPVRFERVCIRDGHSVAWEDLVKGYEYSKGHFVVVTKEDFKTAAVEKTRTIDILDFVKADEIDDRFFETPYYLVPSKSGEHAYALLREAIRASGRVGIAKFILREGQHLAAIEAIDEALVLTVMRFSDELADIGAFTFPRLKDARKGELEMAKTLVNNLAAGWDPSKYRDEYRENLLKVIKARVKGKSVHLKPEEPHREASVVNLMERLRQSLEERGGKTSSRAKRQTGKAPSARSTKSAQSVKSTKSHPRPRRAA